MKIGFKNDRLNIISADIIPELEGITWFDAPEIFNQELDKFILVDGAVTPITKIDFDNLLFGERLRILRVVDAWVDIKSTDFTLLSLDQSAWEYSRGARIYREYKHNDDLVVRDSYNYTMDAGNRNVAGLTRLAEWYTEDGSVGLSKTMNSTLTVKSLGELNQTIRNGRITDLFANAAALPGGQAMVDSIYSWYGDDIISYIDRGTLDFENDLKNESVQARLDLLNTQIAQFGNATIKQLLSFQLIGDFSL